MKPLKIRKTINPVSVFIVDDEYDRITMLSSTVAATGNVAKYVNSYERAVDSRNDYYDIVVCDVFLHAHDPSKGTGFDFRKSYQKIHKDTMFILYSGNKGLLKSESMQTEVLDSMQLQDVLVEAIDRVDRKKELNKKIDETDEPDENEQDDKTNIRSVPMQQQHQSEQYNSKLCDERHLKLDKSIERLNNVLSRFSFLFIGAIVTSAFAIVLSCIKFITQ